MELIETVCELIRQRLNAFFQNIDRTDEDRVVLSNIVDHDGAICQSARDKIVMVVTNITHETIISTYNPAVRASSTTYAVVSPPLYINLFILFFANFYDRRYSQGLAMISRTISFFQQNPWFTHANAPELDPRIDKITLEITNLDMLQANYLMGMLGTKYLPSVYYKLRLIPFTSEAMQATVPAAQGVDAPKTA